MPQIFRRTSPEALALRRVARAAKAQSRLPLLLAERDGETKASPAVVVAFSLSVIAGLVALLVRTVA